MYVYIYIYRYMYMCVRMYVYIYIYISLCIRTHSCWSSPHFVSKCRPKVIHVSTAASLRCRQEPHEPCLKLMCTMVYSQFVAILMKKGWQLISTVGYLIYLSVPMLHFQTNPCVKLQDLFGPDTYPYPRTGTPQPHMFNIRDFKSDGNPKGVDKRKTMKNYG